jgi:hypothetical protein
MLTTSVAGVKSWSRRSKKVLDKVVDFSASNFGGVHSAFWLKITCSVRRTGFMLCTLPLDAFHPYHATAYSIVRSVVFSILGGYPEVDTQKQS